MPLGLSPCDLRGWILRWLGSAFTEVRICGSGSGILKSGGLASFAPWTSLLLPADIAGPVAGLLIASQLDQKFPDLIFKWKSGGSD